jgi:hypothetical protein
MISEEEHTPQLSSEDREDREEMKWSSNVEILLKDWSIKSLSKSKLHGQNAKKLKKYFYSLSIPCVIIPFGMSISSVFWGECSYEHKLTNAIISCVLGSLNGLNTLFNLGSLYQLHFEAETKYMDLHTDIESTLVKSKKDRIAVDVFLERAKLQYEYIEKIVPSI